MNCLYYGVRFVLPGELRCLLPDVWCGFHLRQRGSPEFGGRYSPCTAPTRQNYQFLYLALPLSLHHEIDFFLSLDHSLVLSLGHPFAHLQHPFLKKAAPLSSLKPLIQYSLQQSTLQN